MNVWEATWCGNDAVAAVTSPGSTEGLWYTARLHLIRLDGADYQELYVPRDQLGWPSASPTGQHVAIVEAICSDRGLVAGDLLVIDPTLKAITRVNTNGVDITYTEWRSDRHLLVAGHRGFDTVVGVYDLTSDQFGESWASREITSGGRYVSVSGCGPGANFALLGEGFLRAPELATVAEGTYRTVRSFDGGYARQVQSLAAAECVTWRAPDGLELQGWLLRAAGGSSQPLIMNIHGGPVWQWRPAWLARPRTLPILMLLQHGYSIFFPNPRGSAGHGQEFARMVKGDMNGADTQDYLSGLDSLIQRGIVDAGRLGVMGVSYGGGMTAWLITQSTRFRAAVCVAPHTNQVTWHFISNIPQFVSLFFEDTYTNLGGKYFNRSPLLHAYKVRTPT